MSSQNKKYVAYFPSMGRYYIVLILKASIAIPVFAFDWIIDCFMIDMNLMSNRRSFLATSVTWVGGFLALSPAAALAQSISSQRDKPVGNGNPQPDKNPTMDPKGPDTLKVDDPNNPLLKKKKGEVRSKNKKKVNQENLQTK
ncbi:MAG: hypothetical protein H7061_12610 [Bdellovibrionaceae bacterium]|nr:hypothetical protein [Bdellovibrio sp.]